MNEIINEWTNKILEKYLIKDLVNVCNEYMINDFDNVIMELKKIHGRINMIEGEHYSYIFFPRNKIENNLTQFEESLHWMEPAERVTYHIKTNIGKYNITI